MVTLGTATVGGGGGGGTGIGTAAAAAAGGAGGAGAGGFASVLSSSYMCETAPPPFSLLRLRQAAVLPPAPPPGALPAASAGVGVVVPSHVGSRSRRTATVAAAGGGRARSRGVAPREAELIARAVASFLSLYDVARWMASVCRTWRALTTADGFWQAAAREVSAASCMDVSRHCATPADWRREFVSLAHYMNKWRQGGAGRSRQMLRISVHVRIKPLSTDAMVSMAAAQASAEEELERKLAEPVPAHHQRPRRVVAPPALPASETRLKTAPPRRAPRSAADGIAAAKARRAALLARQETTKKMCAWDREAPRFTSFEHEARKAREAEEERLAQAAAAAARVVFQNTHEWGKGLVTVADSAGHKEFNFGSTVLQPTFSQERAYGCVVPHLLRSFMMGYDCSLLAYGQTASGKTHSMLGPPGALTFARYTECRDPANPYTGVPPEWGFIPRLMIEVMKLCDAQRESVNSTFSVSAVEVYMEEAFDLLRNRRPAGIFSYASLRQRENHGELADRAAAAPPGSFGVNAAESRINDVRDIVQLCRLIETSRIAATTNLNERSSRSHCVLTCTLTQCHNVSGKVLKSKFLLVDLAGSERINETGSTGKVAEESVHINTSLTCLGRCIRALAQHAAHVPYRDSMLTKLLSESLGGNCRTAVVVTTSQDPRHAGDTLSSLRFGERTAEVANVISRGTEDATVLLADTRAAIAEAERALLDLSARGLAGKFNKRATEAEKNNFLGLRAQEQQLQQDLSVAVAQIAESVRTGARTGAVTAFRDTLQARLQRVQEDIRRCIQAGLWREPVEIVQQKEAELMRLRILLAQLMQTTTDHAEEVIVPAAGMAAGHA